MDQPSASSIATTYVVGFLAVLLSLGCASQTGESVEPDKIVSFDDREAQQAAEQFIGEDRQPLYDVECAPDALESVAEKLEAKHGRQTVGDMYDWCLETFPESRYVPMWLTSITKRRGDKEKFEGWIDEHLNHLAADGRWYSLHEDDSEAVESADKWVKSRLLGLGNRYHKEARYSQNYQLYRRAADYYHRFVDRFPDHHLALEYRHFLGQIYLYELDEFQGAAVHYQQIVDDYFNDEIPEDVDDEFRDMIVRDAAYSVIVAYNHRIREKYPDHLLAKMAERARRGEAPEPSHESRSLFVRAERAAHSRVPLPDGESRLSPRQELKPLERQYVESSVQFFELYPDDDITPTVHYVAAEVYCDRGHYDECIPMYLQILESTPAHTYASFAGTSVMTVYYEQKEMAKVETVARYMLEHHIFDVASEKTLEAVLEYIADQRGGDSRETAPTLDELK